MNAITIRVIKDLCLGCGRCTQVCRHDAIIIIEGKAEILQARCRQCGDCIDVCPSGAIIEHAPVSVEELRVNISQMQKKTDELLNTIERCLNNIAVAEQGEEDSQIA